MVWWARGKGCRWGDTTYSIAAKHRHLDPFQWAQARECPLDIITCCTAPKGTQLTAFLLAACKANEFSSDASTCRAAAGDGQLEIPRWALEQSFPWSQGRVAPQLGLGTWDRFNELLDRLPMHCLDIRRNRHEHALEISPGRLQTRGGIEVP